MGELAGGQSGMCIATFARMPAGSLFHLAVVLLAAVSAGCDPCAFGNEWDKQECRDGREDVWRRYSEVRGASTQGEICYVFRSGEGGNVYGALYTGRLPSHRDEVMAAPFALHVGERVVHGQHPAIACTGDSTLVAWVDLDAARESVRFALLDGAGERDRIRARRCGTASSDKQRRVAVSGRVAER